MSVLVGPAVNGKPGDIHTAQKNPIGMIARSDDGGEFIYLKGVVSTVLGSWVNFLHDGTTALSAQGTAGPLAIAMAAVVATQFGWYCIVSPLNGVSGLANAGIASNSKIYLDSAAQVHSTAHANDWVANAFSRSTAAAGLATFEIARPFVSNGGYLT
jgi:hypothetical protein